MKGPVVPAQATPIATAAVQESQQQDELERRKLADQQRLRDQIDADFSRIMDALDGSLRRAAHNSAQQLGR